MTPKMFSSEVELGKFLGSIGVIPDAYRAISETSNTYQDDHTTRSGIQVLAFNCFPDYTNRFSNGEYDLVSSEDYGVLEFISTKVNPKFSINKAAVELFELHFDELSNLSNQLFIRVDDPLVITGRGLGGYLAILFTLLHQHTLDVKESTESKTTKRPISICITFGTPLLGDQCLQGTILQRPLWKSCFLNMVSITDPLACFFTSTSQYKPFGTFLFCTESGGHTAFEDHAPIMAVLDAMVSLKGGDNNFQMHDYKNDLGLIRKKVMYRGGSMSGEFNLSSFRAGITSQFLELCLLNNIPDDLIAKMEDKQENIIRKTRNTYDPTKKLNNMKKKLTILEWYMKTRRKKGGYYDVYKNGNTRSEIESQAEIVTCQGFLNQHWKEVVEEKDQMPQKEGAKLRKRWLYGGTNYRRIVEPLDIADHYRNNKTNNINYIAVRPNHYKLLEKWLEDDKKNLKPSERKTKAASLTEDSCFWAYVEEALISLHDLKKVNSHVDEALISQRDLKKTDLERFEAYVLDAINDLSLSPDVFVEGSSLMKWWNEYDAYKGSSYISEFAQYMRNEKYRSY